MHELAFADAARPTPVVVLKLPLRDYSLGHELLLLQRRNPLITLPVEEFDRLAPAQQRHAIMSAVIICCDDCAARLKLESPSLFGWRMRWHQFKIWNWQRHVKKDDFPVAIAEFRNYLADRRALPPMPTREASDIANGEHEGNDRALGSPLLANLVNFVTAHPALFQLHSSLFDVPYALAAWLYFAHLESEGRIRIENQKEFEIRREMDEHRAAVAAEERVALSTKKENQDLATNPPLELFGKESGDGV